MSLQSPFWPPGVLCHTYCSVKAKLSGQPLACPQKPHTLPWSSTLTMESWPSLFVCRACPGWTPQPHCFGLVAVQVPLTVLTVSAEMPMEPFLGERGQLSRWSHFCVAVYLGALLIEDSSA